MPRGAALVESLVARCSGIARRAPRSSSINSRQERRAQGPDLDALQDALERAGVEFIEGGVRLQGNERRKHRPPKCGASVPKSWRARSAPTSNAATLSWPRKTVDAPPSATKTAKLRELRLAQEAAEREGAQKAKPRKDGERR